VVLPSLSLNQRGWPDFPEAWKYVDRSPHREAEQQASEVYERLVRMESDEPLRLGFSLEAQVAGGFSSPSDSPDYGAFCAL
jgi:hypothetical protein